jgi:hypothetical protein
MKNKLSSILCVVLMSWPLSGFTQVSFGDIDCGQWIKNNRSQDRAWLLGFLTGLNVDKDSLNSLKELNSAEQTYLFVDNYCRNKPLEKVSSAGMTLYIELLDKNIMNKKVEKK